MLTLNGDNGEILLKILVSGIPGTPVLAAIMLVFLAASGTDLRARDLQDFANECADQPDNPLHRAAYCRYVAEYTGHPGVRMDALMLEAILLSRAGLREMAESALDRLLEAFPDEHAILELPLVVHLEAEEYFKAVEDYTRLIAYRPDMAVYWFGRGEVQMRQHRDAEAIDDFAEALKLNPDLVEARRKQGEAYFRNEQFDEAADAFSAAARAEPEVASHTRRWADAVIERGKYFQGYTLYRLAYRIDPNDPENAREFGIWHYEFAEQDSEFAQVRTALQKSTAAMPNDGLGLFVLALAHSALGDKTAAMLTHRRTLGVWPEAVADYKESLIAAGLYAGEPNNQIDSAFWVALEACAASNCKLWD